MERRGAKVKSWNVHNPKRQSKERKERTEGKKRGQSKAWIACVDVLEHSLSLGDNKVALVPGSVMPVHEAFEAKIR